jgi:O-6-methylguanine DNA methyltransferase
MNIKYVSSPIGFFQSTYSDLGLRELRFFKSIQPEYPHDSSLQKYINQFFSPKELDSLPEIDLIGTDFQLKVWNALCQISRGATESYLSIAKQIGSPGAFRAVGTACKINPVPIFIPCHRVIKQDQSIGEFALGAGNKKALLEMESL